MIPQVIHYCWFGKNELPDEAKKCISSWKKYLPEYEIHEWNEDNFDVSICPYVQEAYDKKKYAFVSDYVRFYVLYNYGGVYFDTDVEIIKPFKHIIEDGAFMGCEKPNPLDENKNEKVAPGLGLAAEPYMELYKMILDKYETLHFLDSKGNEKRYTVVNLVTDICMKYGFKGNGDIESIMDVCIYPSEYFCPVNYFTGEITITEKTHSIHHYSDSWHSDTQKKILKLEAKYGRYGEKGIFGKCRLYFLRAINKIETNGLRGFIAYLIDRFFIAN